jgi:glycerol-3-phosphate dehydrogenase (NAD(P)+)
MELKTGLLGGGSWGTTVAALVARNAPITMWARDPATVEEINTRHTNRKYLPDATLPDRIVATASIGEAVSGMDVIIMAIPSQSFRAVLEEIKPFIRPWVPVVSLSKGIELSSGKRMSELIQEVLPGHPAGVLTGPNLAREIMAGFAAASVIAMEDEIIVKELQKLFHSGLFRVYTNHDVIGCELGGVLKNIIAIAAGMGDGQGAGENTRSAVITRGLAEITRLGVAMGGEPQTFAGLAGTGDHQRDVHGGRGSQERARRDRTGGQVRRGHADRARGVRSDPGAEHAGGRVQGTCPNGGRCRVRSGLEMAKISRVSVKYLVKKIINQ